MSEIIRKVSPEQKILYEQKFKSVEKEVIEISKYSEHDKEQKKIRDKLQLKLWGKCTDPTIFAYVNLKDNEGNPYKLFDYQDLIINDKSQDIIIVKGRQIGITDIVSIKSLHTAIFKNNSRIIVASRTQPLAKEIIDRVKYFLNTCPITYDPKKHYKDTIGDTDNKFEISIRNWPNKKNMSRISSVVASDSSRGKPADLLIMDEAAFIENGDDIYRNVFAPMVTFTKGQRILISTPPPNPMGFFFEAYKSPYWSRYQFNSLICPRITIEYLEREKKSQNMLEATFKREFMGEFFSSEHNLFTPLEISDATDEEIKLGMVPNEEVYMGIDWGETQARSAFSIVKAQNPKDPERVLVKVVDLHTYPKKTDYAWIIDGKDNNRSISSQYDKYKGRLRLILADAGCGRGQIAVMRDMGLPVEEYTFGGILKSGRTKKEDMVTQTKWLFENRRIKIPNHHQLIDELSVYQQEYIERTGRTKYHSPEKGKIKDHLLDSFMMANYAAIRIINPAPSISFEAYAPKPKTTSPIRNKGRLVVCSNCQDYFRVENYVEGRKYRCDLC